MHQDLLNDLINALTILPGVGKKSAQRMALYLLDKNKDGASILAKTMQEAVEEISRCMYSSYEGPRHTHKIPQGNCPGRVHFN